MEIIYCGGGNPRFYQIATEHGFLYGAQMPDTVYGHLWFADQNWKNPNRERYMAALAEHRPHVASVLDWEQEEQLPEVLSWAEEAAQWVQVVMIIPKVFGGIERLPRQIGGADVRLGYSIPTRHGGTEVPIWEFAGWPVHLLGGSPQAQHAAYMHLSGIADVASADGNYMNKMATKYNQFWAPGTARYASNRWWPTLREANDGELWGSGGPDADAPYEAFRRSCENIMAAWKELLN